MKPKLFTLSLFLLFATIPASPQGLKFNGQERIIHERTSLDVFGKRASTFRGEVEISFSFCSSPVARFGYVLRMLDRSDQPEIWNLSFDSRSEKTVIMLNEEGKRSVIRAEFEDRNTFDYKWTPFKIKLDAVNSRISLSVGDSTYSESYTFDWKKYRPDLFFGLSGHVVDVPSFAIRELRISDASHSISFPLDELEGSKVHDSRGIARGSVTNPVWMRKDASQWEQCCSMSSDTPGGVFYDALRSELCLFNSNSIQRFNTRSHALNTDMTEGTCPVHLLLGTNYLKNRKLYVYELNDWTNWPGGASIASLDLNSLKWESLGNSRLNGPMHHHGLFIRKDNGNPVIFGGFGNMEYNGEFITLDSLYHCHRIWRDSCKTLFPRFFSSCGLDENGDYAYFFGGMGNESGDQVVGRKYFYDLHKVDTRTGKCIRLWSISPEEPDFVPARNLIVDGEYFYVLCYPEYLTESVMHLYKFSIKDGSYEKLQDGINVVSDKIWCYSSLFLDKKMGMFIVATMNVDNDLKPEMDAYTLLYPPCFSSDKISTQMKLALMTGTLLLCILFSLFIIFRKYTTRKHQADSYSSALADPRKRIFKQNERPNSIYLFGDFTVRDRNGQDISEKFSNQQRSILFLLLKYEKTGLSSVRLSSLMWPDKEENKVKNSRGVAINSLRKNLSMIDGVSIMFEDGAYRIATDGNCRCDLLQLYASRNTDDKEEALRILSRGKFLLGCSDPMFDSFKEETADMALAILSSSMERNFAQRKYHPAIEIADMIFGYDPLDENALHYQVQSLLAIHRRDDAMVRYAAFAAEFQRINDSSYPIKFEKV